MKVNDPCNFKRYLSSSDYGQKNSGLNGDANPDSSALLCQLSSQANRELVIWVDFKYSCLSSGTKICEDHSPLFQSTVLMHDIHVFTSYN